MSNVKFLNGIKALLTTEKQRGMVTALFSGSISSTLNIISIYYYGVNVTTSTFIFINLIGGFLSYTLDILFAKKKFADLNTLSEISPVIRSIRYSNFGYRWNWFLKSFINRPFQRFIVAIIIETLTGVSVLKALLSALDRHNILTKSSRQTIIRNILSSMIVSVSIFWLFGNILRFDWAYNMQNENETLTIAVLMWMALTLLIYALFYTIEYRQTNLSIPSNPSNL